MLEVCAIYACCILALLFATDQEYMELNIKCTSSRQLNKMTSELEVCCFMCMVYVCNYVIVIEYIHICQTNTTGSNTFSSR